MAARIGRPSAVWLAWIIFSGMGCLHSQVADREQPQEVKLGRANSDSAVPEEIHSVSPIAADLVQEPNEGVVERQENQSGSGPPAWGIVGLRGYAFKQQVAPNGLEFNALFAMDLNFNLWLWRSQGAYLFSDTTFWGQRASPGITNANQGVFDFSKREFDFSLGLAWNYYGPLEARAFAYSFNNLNRGASQVTPSGYADGCGLENRYYLGPAYANLGTPEYDVARAPFVSAGFFPTKEMVNADGDRFRPGLFVRAYLTLDLFGPRCYLFGDAQLIVDRTFSQELFKGDFGIACRPFSTIPGLEFRLGSDLLYDPHSGELETGLYGQIRYLF